MSDVVLSDEQRGVLDQMENTLDHVFITGRAGTGKSTLLQAFVASTAKVVAVCAPTGVAALAVGGQTIHSLLRLPIGIIGARELGFIPKESLAVLANLDALVIDEVSMVSADVLDAMDRRLSIPKSVQCEHLVPFSAQDLPPAHPCVHGPRHVSPDVAIAASSPNCPHYSLSRAALHRP